MNNVEYLIFLLVKKTFGLLDSKNNCIIKATPLKTESMEYSIVTGSMEYIVTYQRGFAIQIQIKNSRWKNFTFAKEYLYNFSRITDYLHFSDNDVFGEISNQLQRDLKNHLIVVNPSYTPAGVITIL